MNEDYEIIINSDLKAKDVDEFKVIKKNNLTYYYVKMKNNGGRCKRCGKYIYKIKEYRLKNIPHSKDIIITSRK